jgi:hypothetical protein
MTATEVDHMLAQKAKEFENIYFSDMTFKPGTFIHDYFIHEPGLDQDGYEVDTGLDIETLGISIASYRFRVSRLRKSEGWCDSRKRMITVSSKSFEDDSALLHEMIHAYEDCLYRRDEAFLIRQSLRDLLTHFMYKSLSKDVINLDEVIHEFIHIRPFDGKVGNGGFHSLLFLLKSLDLDLRLEKKIGTVFGYGLNKYIY